MAPSSLPIDVSDPVNARILAVSEDRLQGFQPRPLEAIAEATQLPLETVIERIRTMLSAGVIRRVRQTVLATSLAPGALVAWTVDPDQLQETFDFFSQQDPFSGHVVIRSADPATPGAQYRLWTTLKVPQGFSMDRHCQALIARTGATSYRLMPARKMFTLGVGHVRRKQLQPGEKTDAPGAVIDTTVIRLDARQWRVLAALKREFAAEELIPDLWQARAEEASLSLADFLQTAAELNEKGVIGRFSTFLEHVKKVAGSSAVTKYNALFHWQVPAGREMEAGQEVGRFMCMTHAYWREGGPEFRNVNIMGVAHGTDKDLLLAHKQAIDDHLVASGIPLGYTNVFWGGRSEIKPSEIMPDRYIAWCQQQELDPETMHESVA